MILETVILLDIETLLVKEDRWVSNVRLYDSIPAVELRNRPGLKTVRKHLPDRRIF